MSTEQILHNLSIYQTSHYFERLNDDWQFLFITYRYLRTSDRKYDIFKIFYEEIYVAVLTSASECAVADKHRPSTLKVLLMNDGRKRYHDCARDRDSTHDHSDRSIKGYHYIKDAYGNERNI